MNISLFKGKSRKTRIFTLVTVMLVAVILALNLVLTHFGLYDTVFLDMTPEGLYSLSDKMKEECDLIVGEMRKKDPDKKIKITFCTDPDYLVSERTARLTYFMALKLEDRYPDMIEVEPVNVRLNPTAVSEYKTTSLSTISSNNIIFSYGGRYRITTFDYFWVDATSGTEYYNGEYRVATIMKSIASLARPAAYFITSHGETVYDPENPESEGSVKTSALASLLVERGMEIKLLDIEDENVKEIPSDCALLIINDPREDFTYDPAQLKDFDYTPDTKKINKYLIKNQGALMVSKDYRVKLPVLETFLKEWGFKFSETVLVDRESSIAESESVNTGTQIIASYNTDENGYGYQLYGKYADLTSAPLTVFKDAGSVECAFRESISSVDPGNDRAARNYASFLTTSANAQRYERDENGEITTNIDGAPGKYDLAALIIRNEIDNRDNVDTNSFIFCVNSRSFFDSELLGNTSYANYDIVSAVVENISRVDEYADADLGGPTQNSASLGGKMIIPMTMSETDKTIYSNRYVDDKKENDRIVIKNIHGIGAAEKAIVTVAVLAVPLAIGIVGAVICIKRRFL